MPNGPRPGPYPCPGGVQGRPIGQPGTITNLYQFLRALVLR